MNLAITSEVEPKQFYRKLEMVFANLETAGPARVFAPRFAREFGEHFSAHLPIQSIVAFDLLGHDPEILYRWGELDLELSEEFIAKLRAVEMPWVGEWADHIAAVFSIGKIGQF